MFRIVICKKHLLNRCSRNTYRIVFTIRANTVYILYLRHAAQAPMTADELDSES